MYTDKIILVTGGTGSWGQELITQLLEKNPKEIRVFSRGELLQVYMERQFQNPKLKFIIGDIRDLTALIDAMKNVNYVFHLAALKHVPICEDQPNEAIKTNILGTRNVIDAAILNQVEKVVEVSTDKAVAPFNLYGMTKSVGERLIIQANLLRSSTQFVCVRAGNVLGSNGSVLPLFINQIKTLNKITLTDEKMTRYFMTLSDAISLLFKSIEHSIGGELFVMKMPVCRIKDLAEVLIAHYGNETTQIEMIGVRPGEKLHEELVYFYELENTYEYDEDYYLVFPTLPIPHLHEHYAQLNDHLKKVALPDNILIEHLLSKEEIETMLRKGDFI